MRVNEIAAAIHLDMVADDRNGYDWSERNGGPETKVLVLGGREYRYRLGDRDCSSSCIEAWRLALQGTPYEGALDGATYTGNMRGVFTASGLFDVWDTGSTEACTGDLYLNDQNHVAMCQSPANPDTLSEFSGNEFGGVYGGQRGDQTGWEGHVASWYDYPWDCTLHYNGKADGTWTDGESEEDMNVDDLMGYRMRGDNGYEASFKERITRMDDKSQEALDTAKATDKRVRNLNRRVERTNELLRETNALLAKLVGEKR